MQNLVWCTRNREVGVRCLASLHECGSARLGSLPSLSWGLWVKGKSPCSCLKPMRWRRPTYTCELLTLQSSGLGRHAPSYDLWASKIWLRLCLLCGCWWCDDFLLDGWQACVPGLIICLLVHEPPPFGIYLWRTSFLHLKLQTLHYIISLTSLPMGQCEEVLLETTQSLLILPFCCIPPSGPQQFLTDTKYASWDNWTKLVCQMYLQAPFSLLIYLAPMLHGPFW